MKSGNTITLLVLLLSTVSAPAQKQTTKTTPPKNNQQVLAPLTLKNAEDSVQYALGAYMGIYMLSGGFTSVDLDYFLAGLEDIFGKRPALIKDSLITKVISAYQLNKQRISGKRMEDQLFASLKDKPGLGRLPNGVTYAIVRSAKGIKPAEKDTVIFNIRISSVGGIVYENSFQGKPPATAVTGDLMPALGEVLQLMPAGSLWQVYIPSAQAYGENGKDNIPPNTALVVDLELLAVKKGK